MILYFSATGNTAFVGNELAKRLNDKAINLLSRIKAKDYTPIHSDKPFVICSPVYVGEMPGFLTDYLKHIDLTGSREAYFIFTSGGYEGISCLKGISLIRKKGMLYRGYANFTMPRNYIASNVFSELSTSEIEGRIADSYHMLDPVADKIRRHKILKPRHVWLSEIFLTMPIVPIWTHMKQGVKDFHVTDQCISCGLCEKLCPLYIIEMKDGKPRWKGGSCAHCMSCIQNCPAKAIEYADVTQKKERYLFKRYSYAAEKQ